MKTFDPHLYIREITLVGCGGTGSLLARSLARMLFDMRQRRMQTPQLRLIDFDTVEGRNCGRQLFQPQEIGQHKSRVLARRYNLAFGLEIAAIAEPIHATDHFERYGSHLVIDAVDNHLARREIAKISGATVLSCGNHHASGQVILGNSFDHEQILRGFERDSETVRYLPSPYMIFPQLLEPGSDPEPLPEPQSCAELVASGEQHLLINDTIANVAALYLYKLLHRLPIHSFMSFIGIDGMPVVRSVPICREELEVFLGAKFAVDSILD